MNSAALERMGILDERHRQDIWREIIKLKLKSDILGKRTPRHILSLPLLLLCRDASFINKLVH